MDQRIIKTIGLAAGLVLCGLVAAAAAQSVNCNDPGPFPKAEEFVAVDKAPELFSETKPVYPPDEKAKGVEGAVWLKVLVDKCGKVKEAMVSKTSGNANLDSSALVAARQNEFVPAETASGPVACWVTYKVMFSLSAKDEKEPPTEKMDEPITPGEEYPSPDEFVPMEIMPERIYEEKPVYPDVSENGEKAGLVWIKVLIDREGTVKKALVHRTSGTPSFDESAVEAAYKCKFKPGIQKGQPVACWVTYKVEFKLNK
jgi:TonB family protein